MFRLHGEVALVVGAGSGIGRGCALRLAAEGAKVAVADIQAEGADETVRLIREDGGTAQAVLVNLSQVESIEKMVAGVVSLYGRIDMLVNVAGICQSKPFLEVTEGEWDRIIDINEKGTAFCMQSVAKQMVSQIVGDPSGCHGKIVNFSSISGRRGRALQIHYAASKAAVISLTQSGALALSPYGITVNAVSPSVVKTPMWEKNVAEKSKAFGNDVEEETREFLSRIPLQRAGTADEMADAVLFLCSEGSNYITGQTLNVDGGFEMD